jgi:hypothetical protein
MEETMKRHNSKATPLLVGELREGQLRVWCPHCKTYHWHGWNAANRSDDVEHRVAHCGEGSPFRDGGYYIGLAPGAGK